MMDAPKRIFAWSGVASGLAGTWGVTRYPDNSEHYILAAEHDRLMADVSDETLDAVERAMDRFHACVVNDNGNVTLDTSTLKVGAWLLLSAALTRLREERRK